MTPRPPTYSTARLDSLVCPVFVDSEKLQSFLPKGARLSLPRLPHVPAGRHPIIVEVWLVQNGLIEAGGLKAHGLWELAGGAAGFGFGGAAGAVNGGALGMWFGPLGWLWGTAAGAATGAMRAGRWAAAAGRKTSETASRVVGTYNEIIATVPCRYSQAAGLASDFALVLGTYTDSAVSIYGERFVGWGYRKAEAHGKRTRDGVLEIRTASGGTPFRVINRQASPPIAPATVRSTAATVLTSLSLPLLGVLPGDRLVMSSMEREFEKATVRVSPRSVRLEAGDALFPALRGCEADINAIGNDDPWGAFEVTGLPVTLSYPGRVER